MKQPNPEPTLQLAPRIALLQLAHLFQQHLFPHVEAETGPLSAHLQLLVSVLAMVPLAPALGSRRTSTGRPPKDRAAQATAFLAKSILNLATTRQLIDRLRCDEALRRLCGWNGLDSIPHESKFSRAFEEFAQSQRLIGHIARDSSAIPVREHFPDPQPLKPPSIPPSKRVSQAGTKAASKSRTTKKSKHTFRWAKASQRGTRMERQSHIELPAMLSELSTQCSIGVKTNSQGNQQYWSGYILHLDVADGQIPISALLTGANVHDSQAAIPLMTITGERVQYLYELMDSAYDAKPIHLHSRAQGHVPLIAPHSRNGTKKPSNMPKVFPPQPGRQFSPAEHLRFRERTMVERVYSRLKDEFGASQIRVRGAVKVMAHLSFGILALTVDQGLKLAT